MRFGRISLHCMYFIIHSGKEDMYRASAIRALCTITDATMLQAIERYMKQAIVDRFVYKQAWIYVRIFN